MILQALYEYYNRSKDHLPAFGRELKEIGFLIVPYRQQTCKKVSCQEECRPVKCPCC